MRAWHVECPNLACGTFANASTPHPAASTLMPAPASFSQGREVFLRSCGGLGSLSVSCHAMCCRAVAALPFTTLAAGHALLHSARAFGRVFTYAKGTCCAAQLLDSRCTGPTALRAGAARLLREFYWSQVWGRGPQVRCTFLPEVCSFDRCVRLAPAARGPQLMCPSCLVWPVSYEQEDGVRAYKMECAKDFIEGFVSGEPWNDQAAWAAGALCWLQEMAPAMYLPPENQGQVGLQTRALGFKVLLPLHWWRDPSM